MSCMSTCLPPFGQLDVGVLREVWDAIRDDEAAAVEGWRKEINRLRRLCWCGISFSKEALTDCFINTETVHGPVSE